MDGEPANTYLSFLHWLDEPNIAAMSREWAESDGKVHAPESTLRAWSHRWQWKQRAAIAAEAQAAELDRDRIAQEGSVKALEELSEEAKVAAAQAKARAQALGRISDKALIVCEQLLDDHIAGKSQVNPTNISAMLAQVTRSLDYGIEQMAHSQSLKDARELAIEMWDQEIERRLGKEAEPKDGRGRWANRAKN